MTCDEITDLVDLYAIGLLENPEADVVRSHLDRGCDECGPRLVKALMQAAQISEALPLVEPSTSLRDRVAASVGVRSKVVAMPQRKARISLLPWLLAAASIAALLISVGYEENQRRTQEAAQASALEASNKSHAIALQAAGKASREQLASMLAILEAPSTKKVGFNITQSNLPHGSLFVHKEFGIAMVVAHLPSAPAGFKYESWVVPKGGAPVPVESFSTDQMGFAFTVSKGPVDLTHVAAMAVSIEPADSTPVKPTKVLFAATV